MDKSASKASLYSGIAIDRKFLKYDSMGSLQSQIP